MLDPILTFSRREQRGMLVLLFLFLTLIAIRVHLPRWYPQTDYSVFLGDTLEPVFAGSEAVLADRNDFLVGRSSPRAQNLPTVVARPHERMLLGINSADTSAWMQLRGIGPVFSKRIVAYRSLLGGFVALEQLYEVYGLSQEQVESMLPFLALDSADIRTINVNAVSVKQLRKHPYVDYYLAKALWDERQLRGRIDSLEQVDVADLIEEQKWRWLQVYLQCGPTWEDRDEADGVVNEK